ncbi:MAG TPA: hypothetical protein GX739_01890 [Firmicutes bacterium]|nr:hypothetical protein [Bacillota bacterium]
MERNKFSLILILLFATLHLGCSSDLAKVRIETAATSLEAEAGDEVILKVVGLTALHAPVELPAGLSLPVVPFIDVRSKNRASHGVERVKGAW